MTPTTSQLSLEALEGSGAAQSIRDRVLRFVESHPGCTKAEVERAIGPNASKRLYELRRAGEVYDGSPATCPVTGRLAARWWPGSTYHQLPPSELLERADVLDRKAEAMRRAADALRDEARRMRRHAMTREVAA